MGLLGESPQKRRRKEKDEIPFLSLDILQIDRQPETLDRLCSQILQSDSNLVISAFAAGVSELALKAPSYAILLGQIHMKNQLLAQEILQAVVHCLEHSEPTLEGTRVRCIMRFLGYASRIGVIDKQSVYLILDRISEALQDNNDFFLLVIQNCLLAMGLEKEMDSGSSKRSRLDDLCLRYVEQIKPKFLIPNSQGYFDLVLQNIGKQYQDDFLEQYWFDANMEFKSMVPAVDFCPLECVLEFDFQSLEVISDILDIGQYNYKESAKLLLQCDTEKVVNCIFHSLLQKKASIYYADLMMELCRQSKFYPPVYARKIRDAFEHINEYDIESRIRIAEFFVHFLSNFGFNWKWDALKSYFSDAREDFMRYVVDRMLRISYFERIRPCFPEFLHELIDQSKPTLGNLDMDHNLLTLIQEKQANDVDPNQLLLGIIQVSKKSICSLLDLMEFYKPFLIRVSRDVIFDIFSITQNNKHILLLILEKLLNYRLVVAGGIVHFVEMQPHSIFTYEVLRTTAFNLKTRLEYLDSKAKLFEDYRNDYNCSLNEKDEFLFSLQSSSINIESKEAIFRILN